MLKDSPRKPARVGKSCQDQWLKVNRKAPKKTKKPSANDDWYILYVLYIWSIRVSTFLVSVLTDEEHWFSAKTCGIVLFDITCLNFFFTASHFPCYWMDFIPDLLVLSHCEALKHLCQSLASAGALHSPVMLRSSCYLAWTFTCWLQPPSLIAKLLFVNVAVFDFFFL